MDVITIDANGKLKLAYNGSYKLQFVTPEQAEALVEYFTPSEIIGSDLDESSAYEQAVREWGQRMAQYNFNQNNRLQTWGLARDYLMRMLGDNNELSIAAGYAQANTLSNGKRNATALFGWFGSTTTVGEILDSFRKQTMIEFSFASLLSITDGLYGMQENAWKSMSATEKADLEFYIILTLIGGEDLMGLDAVTQVSAYEEYKYFEKRFLPEYRYYEKRNKWWRPNAKRKFKQLRDLRDAYKGEWGALQNTVASGGTEINKGIASFNSTYQAYVDSCEKINTIKGKKTGDEYVIWEDVEKALMAAGTLTADEITELSVYWTDYIEAGERKHKDVSEALAGLANWSESARKDARDSVESQWKFDEQERKAKEQVYRDVYEAYIDGIATKEQLEAAAAEVYGEEAAARKTHQKNMAAVLISDLDGIIEDGGEHMTEYLTLANEYALLIRQAYGTRFEAELAAREAEWEQQTRDINEKYKAWVEASGLILERGREDWLSGIESFNQKHAEWRKRFEAEYTQVSNAWAAAYLEGLEEKSAWVEQATEAADNALTGTMLAMVGIDAEAGARKFDTLDPVGMPGLGGVEEASTALDGLLNMAGITGMETAFTAMAGSAGTIATQVQRGLGGISGMNTWNSGQIQVAATAFARESNALLAAGEAKKLAYMAREIAEEAIEGLYTSVKEANENFSESMDENFAAWEKNGNTYTKRFIAYSTLLSDKYERVSVAGYREYIMSPFNFETDLSEERLINLSSLAIQVLISDAQEEVKEKSEEIFGTADENTKKAQSDRTETINVYKKKKVVTGFREVVHTIRDGEYTTRVPIYEWQDELKDTQYRSEGAGEYGRHIGYAPVTVAEPDVDKGKNSLFVNSGKGELGRLMSEYIYYQMKEDLGWAYSQRAPWEKPLWDDRDTTINAPSLRSVVDIGMQIVTTVVGAVATPFTGGASLVAAIAVNTAMNVADDAVFGALDVAGGFKTFGEAGFEFGKKVLSSAATSTISAGFGGFGSFLETPTKGLMGAATNGLTGMSKVLTQTVVSGMQTMTTTLVNSTINSFTYSEEDKFGFSGDIFAKSMQGGLISMAGGMTSTFTSGLLGHINLGENASKVLGFNNQNIGDMGNLNNLLGGLAGQGVEYALGGNFTLNVLNLSMFGIKGREGSNPLINSSPISMGLLELRFGRDGFDMGLGTGGVDASYGTIASAVRGTAAWGTSTWINSYTKNNEVNAAVALRAQYGYGDKVQKDQLFDILRGNTTLLGRDSDGFGGQTITENGKRTVYLDGYYDGMSEGEQFALAVLLGHEAYRDGYGTGANTQQAVQAHVEMLKRIQDGGENITMNGNLVSDMAIYDYAKETGNWGVFEAYVREAYDSSADNWQLTNSGKLLFDGKATVYNHETGEVIISLEELGMSDDNDYATALSRMLGVSTETANKIIQDMFANGNGRSNSGGVGIQIQGGKTATALDYQNALINTVNSRLSGAVGLEQPFVSYNGQDVNIFKNYLIILLGSDIHSSSYELSKIGQPYSDEEWNRLTMDEATSPLTQALFAGMGD
ncbi:hypothetical protein LJC14_06835, partial [Treponema sp. OttesenSCG-928-L16]|nr:hypothetical protein [Treponema sp. OttesenSCG-928-L16]